MNFGSALLNRILDEIPAVVIIHKEKPIWFNRYTLKLTDYSEEEIKNEPIQSLFPSFKEEKIETLKEKAGEEFSIKNIKRKDGTFVYLKVLCRTIKIEEELYGLIIGIDITSEVELKNKLKFITVPIQEVEIDRKKKAVKVNYLNTAIFELTGYKSEELEDFDSFMEKVHPEDRGKLLNFLNGRYKNSVKVELVFRFKKKSGRYLWIRSVNNNIRIEGEKVKFLSTWIDITKEKRLQKKLENLLSTLENLLKYSPDVIFLIDKKGRILWQSESLTRLGYRDKEAVGKNILDFIFIDDKEKFLRTIEKAIENPNRTFKFEYRFLTKTGKKTWSEGHIVFSKNLKKIILVQRDISDRKHLKEKLKKATLYDVEASLPNISMFKKYLKSIIKVAKSESECISLILLKIVNLKDLLFLNTNIKVKEVLRIIVKRIENEFPTAYIGRLSFDEFIVSIYAKNCSFNLSEIIQKFHTILKEPIGQFSPLYNIGIALFPSDAKDENELLKKSFLSLKKAMELGVNSVSLYSSELERELMEKQVIRVKLAEAIKNKELTVYYQPIYSLKDSKIVGFEALIRWFSKELGAIPPDKFIPIVEETDLILEIGRFALRKSLEDIKSLGKNCFVSVNFSSKQFSSKKFLDDIMNALERYSFNPELLVVEITERTAMENPEYTSKLLEELRRKRIKIALDDFGKGYSNMEYLIDFDIDKLKIDKDFVLRMLESKKAKSVVRTIVDLAHSVGAVALAEGIENEETAEELRRMGCEEGQGFYFMPPVPFEKIRKISEREFCEKTEV